jgi:HAD superfamily hydrolase (TIGR01450 family)
MPGHLVASADVLAKVYDVALLDLDGVVYVGAEAVPGAPEALAAVRRAGMRLAFVTNNAARPPRTVADHLTMLGIPAEPGEVITSSHAAAHYLADRLPPGAAVLVVGTTGLIEALRERGLRPVESADDEPAAVVQGYSPELDWHRLAEGAVAIRRGIPWIATNLDPTVPSPRGPLPGNGSLVAALRHATGVTPIATGKPDPTMHRESVQRSNAERPLVVGDRLDTDIEGAAAAGCPSLLVLSGVTTPRELLSAPQRQRPDFLAGDVAGLLAVHPGPVEQDGWLRVGVWRARIDEHAVLLERCAGDPDDAIDGLDPLRAACAAAWQAPDRETRGVTDEGETDRPTAWLVRAEGEAATKAVEQFDLG